MARYRKRPVIVEAEQWFPGKEVPGVTEVVYCDDNNVRHSAGYGHCVTIHGQVTRVDPGDFMITEPDGKHHYPCKPEIFEASYEPVL